jgi:hypothetical protein
MRNTTIVTAAMMLVIPPVLWAQQAGIQEKNRPPVSFKQEVFPIIKKHCLPCHAEDNYNPSELVLDTYETLMKGGEHGKALEPGKGAESLIVKKLGPQPPFGKVMPVDKRKKPGEESKNKVTEDEFKALVDWIDQGAKNN